MLAIMLTACAYAAVGAGVDCIGDDSGVDWTMAFGLIGMAFGASIHILA